MTNKIETDTLEVEISRTHLAEALGILKLVAPKGKREQSAIPVLACAKVVFDYHLTTLSMTDLDNMVCASVPSVSLAPETHHRIEEAVIEYDFLQRVLTAATKSHQAKITLELPATGASIRATINDLAIEQDLNFKPDDFPTSERYSSETRTDLPGPTTLSVTAKAWREVISYCAPAISTEETRYYLNGLDLALKKQTDGEYTLTAVSTDGHRLHHHPIRDFKVQRYDKRKFQDWDIIIPTRAVVMFDRLCTLINADRVVFLYVYGINPPKKCKHPGCGWIEHKTLSKGGVQYTVASKLIDGTFPDWPRVIPTKLGSTIEMRPHDLLKALEALPTNPEKRRIQPVKLTTQQDSDDLRVVAIMGASSISLRAAAKLALRRPFKKDGFSIGINQRYLKEALKILNVERHITVTFSKKDPATSPCVIADKRFRKPEDPFIVLMPVRV